MNQMLALAENHPNHMVPVVETKSWRPTIRLVGLASITVTFLAASSAPTPLYATYQKAWGFSALTTTVVFGVYALWTLFSILLSIVTLVAWIALMVLTYQGKRVEVPGAAGIAKSIAGKAAV